MVDPRESSLSAIPPLRDTDCDGVAVSQGQASPASVSAHGQRLVQRPPSRQSLMKRTDIDAEFACPLRDGLGAASVCQPVIVTPILGLLMCGCPPAIFWRVGPVVVNTVKRVGRRWSPSHVSIERLERFTPSVAHDDTASTIARICRRTLVIATTLRACPRRVLGQMTLAVCRKSRSGHVTIQAAATPCRFDSANQYISLHNLVTPAVTPAPPHPAVVTLGPKQFNRNQSAEALTSEVRHHSLMYVFAHV